MIKINVPWFEQTKMMCGQYALKQILAFYGDDVDIKEITHKLGSRIDLGVWSSQILAFVKNRGYKVDFCTNSLRVLDLSWEKLSSKKIADKLRKRLKFKKEKMFDYKAYIKYFSSGGSVNFEPITKETIKKYLDKKKPVLMCVNSTYFYHKKRRYKGKFDDIKGNEVGHYIVVAGYDKKRFFIVDPGSKTIHKGKYWVDQDFLIVSTLIWGGWLNVIWK